MPQFRIVERVPSGIRFQIPKSRAQFYAEENAVIRPSETWVVNPPVFNQESLFSLGDMQESHGILSNSGCIPQPSSNNTEENWLNPSFGTEIGDSFFTNLNTTDNWGPCQTQWAPSYLIQPQTVASFDTQQKRSSYTQLPPHPPSKPEPYLDDNASWECLPLLKVDAEVFVAENVARTTLLQSFGNNSKDAIDEARYTFPLYDGAVVVGFTCKVGEERELVGKVQAKDEARKEYKKAIDKLETAALLEEHTPEIFETIIGNIPAETEVTVRIHYVHEIKNSILDTGVAARELVIPMSIAPRYGGLDDYGKGFGPSTKMEPGGLNIAVKVNNNGKVKRLHSNHHVDVEENVPVQLDTATSFSDHRKAKQTQLTAKPLTQMIARYASTSSIMDEDFIVSIEPQAHHPVQSHAVLSPADEHGYAALMISVNPAEFVKERTREDKFDGEIIFVLDRSGSMDGRSPCSHDPTWASIQSESKISTLRSAMFLSLSSLPAACRFNIVSFGTDTEFLWVQSQAYTQSNLEVARTYVQEMTANFGGTELSHAVKKAVDSRLAEAVSTQIILITDGEVEPECVLRSVWDARQKLGANIRFFALGIGHNVPRRLINRIGEFGGGYGEVIDIRDKPEWTDRLIFMLSSGIMPKTWTCDIDLGPSFQRSGLSSGSFGQNHSGQQDSKMTEAVPFIQGPYPIPPQHPFSFRTTFLLLGLRSGKPPNQVILRAKTNRSDATTEHKLVVESTTIDTTSIQHLAARRILLDMEADMSRQHFSRAQIESARQTSIKLGILYSITSRWTSFVAIEGSKTIMDGVELYRAGFRQKSFEDTFFSRKDFHESGIVGAVEPFNTIPDLAYSDSVHMGLLTGVPPMSAEPLPSQFTTTPLCTKPGSILRRYPGTRSQIPRRAMTFSAGGPASGILRPKNKPSNRLCRISKRSQLPSHSTTQASMDGSSVSVCPTNRTAGHFQINSSDHSMITMPAPTELFSFTTAPTSTTVSHNFGAQSSGVTSSLSQRDTSSYLDYFAAFDESQSFPGVLELATSFDSFECGQDLVTFKSEGNDTVGDNLNMSHSLGSSAEYICSEAWGTVGDHATNENPPGIERNDNTTEDQTRKPSSIWSSPGEEAQITWVEAAGLQGAHGLFKLDETSRAKLNRHFQKNTAALIDRLLVSKFPLLTGTSIDERRAIVDTVFLIHYFRTHWLLQKDVWIMMIEKAESATLARIGAFEGKELNELMVKMDLSAMHQHLGKHLNYEPDQKYCPFIVSGMETCGFCHKHGEPNTYPEKVTDMDIRTLYCSSCITFRSSGLHRYWALWRHMIHEGHACS